MSTSTPGWPNRPNPLEQELVEERERAVEREVKEGGRRHEAEASRSRKRPRWWPFGRRLRTLDD